MVVAGLDITPCFRGTFLGGRRSSKSCVIVETIVGCLCSVDCELRRLCISVRRAAKTGFRQST
jgi:hypothetical protein